MNTIKKYIPKQETCIAKDNKTKVLCQKKRVNGKLFCENHENIVGMTHDMVKWMIGWCRKLDQEKNVSYQDATVFTPLKI